MNGTPPPSRSLRRAAALALVAAALVALALPLAKADPGDPAAPGGAENPEEIQGRIFAIQPLTNATRKYDVVIELGSKDGVVPGMKFSVLSPVQVVYVPGTRKVLWQRHRNVGSLTVERVDSPQAGLSVCKCDDESLIETEKIKSLYFVVGRIVTGPGSRAPIIDPIRTFQTLKNAQPGQVVKCVTIVTDEDDGSNLNLFWECDRGQWLAERTREHENYWTAPSLVGPATLTVKVYDPDGNVAEHRWTVEVGPMTDAAAKRTYRYHDSATPSHILGQATKPTAFTLDGQGNLLMVHGAICHRRTMNLRKLLEPTTFKVNGSDIEPSCLVTAGQEVYLLDKRNYRIHAFSVTGTYLYSFSEEGNALGSLQAPVDICTNHNGNLNIGSDYDMYVLDRELKRVSVFSILEKGQRFIGAFGSPPSTSASATRARPPRSPPRGSSPRRLRPR
jgi:hypothetical protein